MVKYKSRCKAMLLGQRTVTGRAAPREKRRVLLVAIHMFLLGTAAAALQHVHSRMASWTSQRRRSARANNIGKDSDVERESSRQGGNPKNSRSRFSDYGVESNSRGAFTLTREDVSDAVGGVFKFRAFVEESGDKRPVSWSEALRHWRHGSSDFTTLFVDALREVKFPAFFWESPVLTASSVDTRDFEFILRDSRSLVSARPDAQAFAEHLLAPCKGRETQVRAFENLGGDALLVSPCRLVSDTAYTHIAAFVRDAPADQVEALWAEIGASAAVLIAERAGRPVWLSTSGLGVYWLHVRMDSFPKYYTYTPYINESPGRRP